MQRRVQSINRQQLQETICRLAKPKVLPMAQSVQLSSVNSSTNGIPASHSSHQLRSSTPPVSIHNRPLPVNGRNNFRRVSFHRSRTIDSFTNFFLSFRVFFSI